MLRFGSRKASRRRNRSLICLIIILAIFFLGGYSRLIRYYLKIRKLQKEVAILKAENELIRMRIARYQNDRELIEHYARDNLGMKKPSEAVIYIIDDRR